MRHHRLAALLAAVAMATASALAAASPAHAETEGFELQSACNLECIQPAGGSSGLGVLIVQDTCNGRGETQARGTPGLIMITKSLMSYNI